MKKKIYLIHHSHTDIGYTETQERALHHQANYLYDIINHFKNNPNSKFRWNCETYVCVEEFLKNANKEEILALVDLLQRGLIELSASYANFAELLSPSIMNSLIQKASTFASNHQFDLKCAMQADVNGFSLGYANALTSQGVEFFMALTHTHHGMYPLFRKQRPFYWQLNNNEKLLVWSGEHYTFGNAFGFAPGAFSSYGFDNEFDETAFNRSGSNEWMPHTYRRLKAYWKSLENDHYPYQFFPACIQGKYTDNAPPNFDIVERIEQWNKHYGEEYEVHLVTLTEFHKILATQTDIPTFHGEWPDWWTDGVASAPRELKLFKNTQSRYSLLKSIDQKQQILTPSLCETINKDLALYSEHTFGAGSSIYNPYNAFCHESFGGKQWYILNAMRNVDRAAIEIEKIEGSISGKHHFSGNFKIKNPHPIVITEHLKLPFERHYWMQLTGNYRIYESNSPDNFISYVCVDGNFPQITLTFQPFEEKDIILELLPKNDEKTFSKHPQFLPCQRGGTDDVLDTHHPTLSTPTLYFTETKAVSPFYTIQFNQHGITSVYSQLEKTELLTGETALFQGVYEISPTTPRNHMGRNRKGVEVKRSYAQLIGKKLHHQNSELLQFSLYFSLSGCDYIEQIITLYQQVNKLSFSIKVHKTTVLLPESLYFSLPLKHNILKVDKESSFFTPRKEQLPGTLIDFYAAYHGICFQQNSCATLISTPDTHLIHYGDLDFRERILCNDPLMNLTEKECYIWAMNNIWETNFNANLGGFYQFDFDLSTHKNYLNDEQATRHLKAMNEKLFSINY